MGIPAEFDAMAAATRAWLTRAIPDGIYRGWLATAAAVRLSPAAD